MRDFLIELLKTLESVFPPPEKCHHSLTYCQYGSEASGWEDRLAIQLNFGGKFHCFFLDEQDCPRKILNRKGDS